MSGYSIKRSSVCPPNWDRNVQKNAGFFYSSSQWANFFLEENIGKPVYITVLDKLKKEVAWCLVLDALIGYPLWFIFPRWIRKCAASFPFLLSKTAYMQPVFRKRISPKEQSNIISLLEKQILLNASVQKCNVSPFVLLWEESLEEIVRKAKKRANCLEIAGTTRICIPQGSEEAWWQSLKNKVRNTIRNADKNSLIYQKVSAEEFLPHLQLSWKRNKMLVNSLNYYETLERSSPDSVEYWLALQNDCVLAGTGLITFGETAIEFSMFATEESYKRKIPAGDGLKWHLLKIAKERGTKLYDLCMIDVDEQDEKTKQINFYKLKWGGEVIYGHKLYARSSVLKLVTTIKNRFIGK